MYEEKHTYYWTCPNCGANLDPGESCDCGYGYAFFDDYSGVEGGDNNVLPDKPPVCTP